MRFNAFKHTIVILILVHDLSTKSEERSSSTLTTSSSVITSNPLTTASVSPSESPHKQGAGLFSGTNKVITTRAVPYPDCSDKTTYRNYYKTSQYKAPTNDIAWDWTTRKTCNLTHILLPPEPATCGDCDFELVGGEWYRFPIGSLGQIVGFPDARSCPAVGHCNGYGQISLIPSSVPPGHPSAKYFGILISNNPNIAKEACFVGNLNDPSQMVQAFQCPGFTLFQFPKASWDSLDANKLCRLSVNGSVVPIPSSICLGDKLSVLQGSRMFFTTSGEEVLSCSSTRSPAPPDSITWTDQQGTDITSLASWNTTLSNLFTAVYSLTPSSSYSSVTCQVEDQSHTFYRVSLEAQDVTGIVGKEVTATCNATFDGFSSEIEKNLFLIEVFNGTEVYYRPENISARGDMMVIDRESSGTYRISLMYSSTSIPEGARGRTDHWKCGVRDPITEKYTAVPFSVLVERNCKPGTGFVALNSTECLKCPENTFSDRSACRNCTEGEISKSGSVECRQERDWGTAVYYVFAGVGAALLIIIVLSIGAVICSRRRRGKRRSGGGDVVISNPTSKNNVNLSRTAV